jgi:hypothetical protein
MLFSLGLSLWVNGLISEPAPDATRVQEEILAAKPKTVMSEISKNNEEGCNTYLIDQGKLSEELRTKCLQYKQYNCWVVLQIVVTETRFF